MTALACIGSLFEKPLPWKEIMAEDASVTEIFGELHFEERGPAENQEPPPSTSSQDPPPEIAGGGYCSKRHSESLQLCTEGLGFESSDTVEISRDISGWEWGAGRAREVAHRRSASEGCSRYCSRRQGTGNAEFPPPISCIGGGGGKPCVRFRSFRRDGRFVLTEVRLPCQELLRAFRKDGRLTLHFVHPTAGDISEGEGSGGDGRTETDAEEEEETINEEDDGAADKID